MSKRIMTVGSSINPTLQNFEAKTPKSPAKYIEALFDKCERPQQDQLTEIKKSLSELFMPGVLLHIIKERESLLKLLLRLHTSLRILIQNNLLTPDETYNKYYATLTQEEKNTELLETLLFPHELAEFYNEIADTYHLFYPDLKPLAWAQNWY